MNVAKMWKSWRRVTIGLVGGSVVVLGVILMPLPGPGTLIVLGGFTILATEFDEAVRVKDWGFRQVDRVKQMIAERRHR